MEEIQMSIEEERLPLGANEEEMEEGEISSDAGEESRVAPRIDLKDRPQHGHLPDLLQEIGNSGGLDDVLDKATSERLEARARRFNLSSGPPQVEDIEALYSSLNIPPEEVLRSREDRSHRLETIFVYLESSRRNVQSKDIYAYFEDFNPVSFEWVSPQAINVIWALPTSAAKALLALSRPIKEHQEPMEMNVRSGMEESHIQEMDEDVINQRFKEPCNTPVYTNEIGGSIVVPQEGTWRFGKPAEFSSFIFMQFASKNQQGNEARRNNHSLMKQEGIISSSLKRKMREAMIEEQELRRQQEERKKYLGPVGKNPWGSIAQSWSESRVRTMIPVPREVILPSRVRDWDAPEEDPSAEGGRLKRGEGERKKRRREPSLSDEEEEHSEDSSSSDEGWKSKLKKPRMTMIADSVESKVSAKNRLYKGAKRRLKKTIKIVEEVSEEESEIEERPPPISRGSISKDLRSRLTLSGGVDNNNGNMREEKLLSERFQSRLGSSLRSRLGERKVSTLEEEDEEGKDDRRRQQQRRSRRRESVSPVRRQEVLSTIVKVDRGEHLPEEERKPPSSSRSSKEDSRRSRSLLVASGKKGSSRGRRRRQEESSSSESSSEDSSDSSSSSESSSESSSSDSSSSGSSSSSDDSYSSTSSSDESNRKTKKKKKKSYSKVVSSKDRSKRRDAPPKKNRDERKKTSSSKSTGGLRDKLKEYLKQAKERKKSK